MEGVVAKMIEAAPGDKEGLAFSKDIYNNLVAKEKDINAMRAALTAQLAGRGGGGSSNDVPRLSSTASKLKQDLHSHSSPARSPPPPPPPQPSARPVVVWS